MLLQLFAADTNRAFEMIANRIDGSAKGCAVVPFYQKSSARNLLEQAETRGDCIAPFLLAFMIEQEWIEHEMPNLTMIPTHKGKGHEWKKALELYQAMIKTKTELPSGNPVIFCKSIEHGKLKVECLKSNATQAQETIHEKIKELCEIKPMGLFLLGKFFEQDNSLAKADCAFNEAALWPNLLAAQYYQSFLQRYTQNIATVSQRNKLSLEENYYNLGHKALLEQYKNNAPKMPEDKYQQHYRNQWHILSLQHAEINPFELMCAYLKPTQIWHDPISWHDAIQEAHKWFQWIRAHNIDYSYELRELLFEPLNKSFTEVTYYELMLDLQFYYISFPSHAEQ